MTADELAGLSEQAARVLSQGGGLKALAQLLADAMEGAVLMEDDQWRHLALAEARGSIGPIPPSFSIFYREAISRSGNGIVKAQISDTLLAICVKMPGQGDGDEAPGYVTLFVRGKTRDAGPALRITASAASIECLRRGSSRGQVKRLFWERYLGGELLDASDIKREAQAAGVQLPAALLAAVFDVEGEAAVHARDAIAQALISSDAVCPLAGSPGHVVALFPIRHQIDVTRARQAAAHVVREVGAGKGAPCVSCGIGGYHADLLGVPLSLDEARQALTLGRRLFGRGAVAVFADLGIFALLHAGADRDAFSQFASRLLDPLAAYDRKHKTDLLMTLQLYFDVGENVKIAAERLSVHRHTIFYRLNQIAQILKVDLKSAKDQLSLRAALAIRSMGAHEESHE